jgi:hypothetical protein
MAIRFMQQIPPASVSRLLMNSIDMPIVGHILKRRFKPAEVYKFWDNYYRGFSTPCRDLRSEDVTNKNKKGIEKVMSLLLTKRRNRLLVKITGWLRIGFIREIFTDAKIIHIRRDGRAVVNSMLDVDWWDGWKGPWNRGNRCFIGDSI